MNGRGNPTSFYERTRSANKILIVDLGFLGDSVHLVPALWEIKRHYPQAQLHALSAVVGAEVLEMAPCLDRAWAFPLGSPSPPWWRHWDLLAALRRARFDLVFNFSGADRTLFLTALTGARWRLIHAAGRRHFWNGWLGADWVPRQDRSLPVYEQRRQVLAACGLILETARFELQVPPPARAWAAENIPAGAIHLSINASTPLKEWPLDHWAALAKTLLRAEGARCVVATGSARPREQERLQALAKAVDHPRWVRAPAELEVARLAAVLGRCALHLGGDSGVLHLAAALGVPTVSLFRQYEGLAEWLPRGENHRHLTAPCPCAGQRQPPCLADGRAACLAGITPAAVAERVRELLGQVSGV